MSSPKAPSRPSSVESAVRRVFAPHLAPRGEEGGWRRLARRWRHTLGTLRPLGAMSRGNRVQVFDDGDLVFESMWEAIRRARTRIRMATYILELDRVGRRTLEELQAASRRGVEVELRVDAVGSPGVRSSWGEDLEDAGVRLVVVNPIPVLRPPSMRWIERDHRKILVVDGKVAFFGGMNVAETYAGERLGNAAFRDTHARLEGPAARDLERMLQDLPPATVPEFERTSSPTAGTFVQVLESDRRRKRRAIQKALRVTLARATDTCYLTSPYFVPPRKLRRAITRAAERGVEVRVLTAGKSDVPIVRLASRHVYGRLLRAGVHIHEMGGRVLHAKTVAIDGVYGTVGSFNLDLLSDRRNREVVVAMLDREVVATLEEQFRADLESSEEVTLETWERRGPLQRLVEWTVYTVGRLI